MHMRIMIGISQTLIVSVKDHQFKSRAHLVLDGRFGLAASLDLVGLSAAGGGFKIVN